MRLVVRRCESFGRTTLAREFGHAEVCVYCEQGFEIEESWDNQAGTEPKRPPNYRCHFVSERSHMPEYGTKQIYT